MLSNKMQSLALLTRLERWTRDSYAKVMTLRLLWCSRRSLLCCLSILTTLIQVVHE